jgi:hypothetical protein
MQVVCSQCHAVCEVDAGHFAAPSSALACDQCSAPLALPAVEVGPDTSWLVLMPQGQAGPYNAAQMAELVDHASIDWGSLVWRAGLKSWRPARRDPMLVTAVASAQGASAFGDTQRVGIRPRSFLPATDTVVEPVHRALAGRASEVFARAAQTEPIVSDDAFTQVTQRVPPSGPVDTGPLPPARKMAPALREPAHPDTQPVLARASAPVSWLPTLQSMSMVALVAFAFGVLAAALWGRYVVRHDALRAQTVVVRPARQPVPVTEPVRALPPVATGAGTSPQVDVQSLSTHVMSEQPSEAELRREVRRVSPDVRRCLDDLSRGADVEAFFEGKTGRVSELNLRTTDLSPGGAECVTEAIRQMQFEPFQRESYRFSYRFSY